MESKVDNTQGSARYIGVDLGTTYSCVGVMEGNNVVIIANDQGNRTMPSYVSFTEQETLVGEAAKNQSAMFPQNTIFDAKRLIGKNYNDPNLKGLYRHWPFKVVDVETMPCFEVEYQGQTKQFRPEQISSMVLTKMKETAEAYLGQPTKGVVITCPAYFNDAQRRATKDAGLIAGMNVMRIINEPTAAAMAYGLDKKKKGEENVTIFDLGGGTFDVSVLNIDGETFEVKAVAGNNLLGGEDFDSRMVDHFVKEFRQKHGKDLSTNPRALRRLRTACERAKRTLSSSFEVTVEVDSLLDGIDLNSSITRARFEDLCADLFRSTLKPIEDALRDAKLSKSQIDTIVMVGGSTRIPKVQQLVKEFFNGKELHDSINPDEAVAYGAAVQAAILGGYITEKNKNALLLDIAPLSLGIETAGGVMTPIIHRGTTIPCKRSQKFSTYQNGQTQIEVKIYEGERARTKDNNLLDNFTLSGIPPAPRGVPVIDIVLDVNGDGILQVTATEKSSGATKQVEVKNDRKRLSKEEIEKLVKEAEDMKASDEEFTAMTKARGDLDHTLNSLQQDLAQGELKQLPGEVKDGLGKLIQDAETWLETNKGATVADIKRYTQELQSKITSLLQKSMNCSSGDMGSVGNMGSTGGVGSASSMDDPNRFEKENKASKQGPLVEEID